MGLADGDEGNGKKAKVKVDPEIELKERINANVRELRRRMERKFLADPRYVVAPSLNGPVREVINGLMRNAEALVSGEEITQDLNLMQIGGISGAAKTHMLSLFVQWSKELDLIEPGRVDTQNGKATAKMNLLRIDDFGKPLNLYEQLIRRDLPFSKRYALFKETAAITHIEEASHFAQPAANLEAERDADITHIGKEYVKARKENYRPARNKPSEPREEDFADYETYKRNFAEYAEALNKWQIADSFATARTQGTVHQTYEDLVRDRRAQYERDREARERLHKFLLSLWSATSGGKFVESVEGARAEEDKQAILDAQLALVRFHAKYEQDTLFQEASQLQGKINQNGERLRASDVQMKDLLRKKATLAKSLSDFSAISPIDIEKWLLDKEMLQAARRHEKGTAQLPEFFDSMMKEITSHEGFVGTNAIGHDPTAEDESNTEIQRFRKEMIKSLELQRDENEHLILDLELRIEAGRKAYADAIAQRKAFERKSIRVKNAENKDHNDLLNELQKLEKAYVNAIDGAIDGPIDSGIAQTAIAEYCTNLTPEKLKRVAHEFYQRLLDLGNNPEEWRSHLAACKDPKIQFAQLLEMNPEVAREIVRKAITEFSVVTQGRFFGNQNVVWTTNIPPLEAEIRAKLDEYHTLEKQITYDEYADLYAMAYARHANWPTKMFDDNFPGMFQPLADEKKSGDKTSNQAQRRRLEGPRGSVFIGPARSADLLNHATTTMADLFEEWKEKTKKKGIQVDGDLFIHQNVPACFVREGDKAELGPNVVINHVKQVMARLLTELDSFVLNRHKANPEEPINMNVAVIDEGIDGNVHRLNLRVLHPNYKQESSNILRGQALGSEWGKATSKEIVIGEGYVHEFKPNPDLKPKPLSLKDLNPDASAPRKYIFPAEDPTHYGKGIPATQKDYEASEELKREEAKKSKKASDDAQEIIATEQQIADAVAAKGAVEKQRDEFRKFMKGLKSHSNLEEEIKQVWTRVDPKLRDSIRDEIWDGIKKKRKGYSLTHLYLWLKNDRENGNDVDLFLSNRFDELAKRARRNMLSLFTGLFRDVDAGEQLFQSQRPNAYWNMFRRSCEVVFPRFTNKGVPPGHEADIQRHTIRLKDFLWGGKKR